LRWLDRQISSHPKDWIVLVQHIPIAADGFSTAVKAAAARSPRVILSIAGHRHTDGFEDIDFGSRRLLQVRTASLAAGPNNWRRIRLLPDRIEISASGQPSTVARTISLDASRN